MKWEETSNFLRTVVGDGLNFVGDRYNVLRIYALPNTTGQPHSMPASIWDLEYLSVITAGGKADHSDENLDDLAKHDLNGRQVGTCFVEVMSSYADRFLLQIRKVVRAAHALASQEGAVTSYSHLEIVIDSVKEF